LLFNFLRLFSRLICSLGWMYCLSDYRGELEAPTDYYSNYWNFNNPHSPNQKTLRVLSLLTPLDSTILVILLLRAFSSVNALPPDQPTPFNAPT
jgi:hypothetical protein